jgi:hypothetical protein
LFNVALTRTARPTVLSEWGIDLTGTRELTVSSLPSRSHDTDWQEMSRSRSAKPPKRKVHALPYLPDRRGALCDDGASCVWMAERG